LIDVCLELAAIFVNSRERSTAALKCSSSNIRELRIALATQHYRPLVHVYHFFTFLSFLRVDYNDYSIGPGCVNKHCYYI